MTVEFLNYISKQTFETILLVGGPVLLVSLLVGLIIGLFQAITQLQEMTISFVPKVIAVFLTLLLTIPWMVNIMTKFTRGIFENLPMYVK
ncbi:MULTISPECIES: flagellar biosynthesis protein FliQ [Thermodesulfovibrio]|jgi:flagellar biosynthetic protein FliQ|uniref:Flagellar biosynthetic protein FliQ n=2 Tax=Thermodesulfovibrio yellowstonii TaxID=28262 RepID=B5YIZ1_THEYD|nr:MULTISPECIES: flagellar biosynthesis protein FliQ [Thermodesulfovibrio]ACI21424.1 flagellar biosynthetic protein FliQ [Thermodesulfovibrio yellowstonii DSM 11347]MDI6864433.1 flagellar biosynthesis protein FliQ [Thermodesulfovibrio yellowstonii]GLI52508.1 flagellar biosynthetic protein FliQ [Thermodesulfovibrio islandicus]